MKNMKHRPVARHAVFFMTFAALPQTFLGQEKDNDN